jgi:hypothetical protein
VQRTVLSTPSKVKGDSIIAGHNGFARQHRCRWAKAITFYREAMAYGSAGALARSAWKCWVRHQPSPRGLGWDLSGSQAIHLVPLPRSKTPAESTIPRHWQSRRCCPCFCESKGFSVILTSRLTAGRQHLLSTLHERYCRRPCKTRLRLAGSPLPGGSRTLWIATKGFRVLHLFSPLLDLSLRDTNIRL